MSICIRIRTKVALRIIFVFGQISKPKLYSYSYSAKFLSPNSICIHIRSWKHYSLNSDWIPLFGWDWRDANEPCYSTHHKTWCLFSVASLALPDHRWSLGFLGSSSLVSPTAQPLSLYCSRSFGPHWISPLTNFLDHQPSAKIHLWERWECRRRGYRSTPLPTDCMPTTDATLHLL